MNIDRDMLFARLAMRLNLLSSEEARDLWSDWRAGSAVGFADRLVEAGRLSSEDKIHLNYLLERLVQKHEGASAGGLATLLADEGWPSVVDADGSEETVAGLTLPPAPESAGPGALCGGSTLPDEPTPRASFGDTAGRFLRVQLHGSGGMGRVWLARDQRLERDVALKELRPDVVGNLDVSRRFLAEARITGRLEHPGIVPIYELVPEGQACSYVMRFVRGRTLSEAIKAYHGKKKEGPAVLERAALLQSFVAVCNTIAFAHARGVLHRDLKGQNILLGDFGEVIVLDWGLAKEVGKKDEPIAPGAAQGDTGAPHAHGNTERFPPEAAARSSSATVPGQVMGTPYYMSPEQAAGLTDRLDQRSDVYSLGAILYEILTGQPPFADHARRLADKSVQALLGLMRTESPTRPRELAPDVPPALEAIALRALAKEPDGRYAGAADLAQEVQRWLADEPVQAHPDPWTVRLGRWARRHRTAVASLGVLALAAITGLAITTFLVNKERAQTELARVKAEQNFHKAQEAVDRYFTKVSEDRLLNEPGMAGLRRELLASAKEFYEDFARAEPQDAASRFALAEAQHKLARIIRAIGNREQALQVLEQAQGNFQELASAHTDVDLYQLRLGQTLVEHGFQLYRLHGRSTRAEGDLTKAQGILAGLVKKDPSRLHRTELAHAHNTIAAYHTSFYGPRDQPDAAKLARKTEPDLLAAVALWQQLAAEEPEAPLRLQDLAGGYTNLARLYDSLQATDKMKDNLDKALDLRRQLVKRFPENLEYQDDLAASLQNFGVYHRKEGQLAQAEATWRDAIRIREKLAKDNCQVIRFQEGLARIYFNLGNMFYIQATQATAAPRTAYLAKGKEAYGRSLEISKRLYQEHPGEHHHERDYAITLSCMGDLVTEDKKSVAIPLYDEAILHLEKTLKTDAQDAQVRLSLRNAYWGRAEGHTDAGEFAQAVADWDRAIELDDGSHKNEWLVKRDEARAKIKK
jgi:serine/threonine-protein kinase